MPSIRRPRRCFPFERAFAAAAAAVLLAVSAPTAARAVSYVILPDGTGHFPTIQAALDAAPPGTEILLANGVFSGAGNRNLTFHGKSLTIRSVYGDPAQCILDCDPYLGDYDDCGDMSLGFQASGAAVLPSRFEGFTIRNARKSPSDAFCIESIGFGLVIEGQNAAISNVILEDGAGGIAIHGGSATVEDCIIVRNHIGVAVGGSSSLLMTGTTISQNVGVSSAIGGGGLRVFSSSATLDRCVISGNSSGTALPNAVAGVLITSAADVEFTNCAIFGNATTASGGGIRVTSGSRLTLENSVIAGNRAGRGGGIDCSGLLDLHNTILWGNCATIEGDDAYFAAGAAATFECSVLDPSRFAGPGSADWSATNVLQDPLFCAPSACTLAPTSEGLYTVYESSPAHDHPKCGRIGLLDAVCFVSFTNDSWGRIKSRYR